jgi:Acetyltransferase (GNAT) domain
MHDQTSFRVLEADGDDRQTWLGLLESWSGREVFAHPNYLTLFAGPGERPVCAVYSCGGGRVIYPFLLRDLRALAFWGEGRDELHDVVSPPYGYGGPFVEGPATVRSTLTAAFFREYELWARSQKVVSEYVIFSPKEETAPRYPGSIAVKTRTIVRDLEFPPETIFREYRATLRQEIRAADRAGVSIVVDLCGARLNDFLEVYDDTMRRRQAEPRFHLGLGFLERVTQTLPGYFAFFHAMFGGKVVAAILVLLSGDSTFFFRGGTLANAFPVHPTKLLTHHAILWSREQGKRFCLLGGGNQAEDSLYRHKLSFAPRGSRSLWVGKWVLNPMEYAQLLSARRAYETGPHAEWSLSPGYFPEYRAPSLTYSGASGHPTAATSPAPM